ncbi:MAG: UvrD-helicase domain-containing protein [Deltaproteobacteria bacterium]|nr:UvrD-helicase domain-containing protein [Deltaproteobacteria bacterium]
MSKMIPDLMERERALDPRESFVVQAPAGSGKTELLMQRYLALLSIVEKPEEIIALTFTKKAAGEMHSRIINSLIKANEGIIASEPHAQKTIDLAKKALERDRQQGWSLLENPGRLKVQTIDSFCSSLIRQMPLLSRMGTQPSITEEPKEFYIEAARRTAQMVEEDGDFGEPVRKALKHLDNSIPALIERLVMMLGRRDQWLRHIKGSIDDDYLRERLEGSLRKLVEAEQRAIKDAFPLEHEKSLISCARFAASNLIDNEKSNIKNLSELKRLPSTDADDMHLWAAIRELLLTKENKWRKKITKNEGFPAEEKARKQEFQELLAALEPNDNLLKLLSRISILPAPAFDEEEWEILDALIHLLPIAEGHLKQVFGEHGVIDFQAISRAALDSLGPEDNPTDLMLSLDLKIKHILVDEYQDTSQTQLELVKALTRGWEQGDGRTLFVVGDPMQSIYLFREAEVGLFLDARINGVGSISLSSLTLKSNFRSQDNIVRWVNGSFSDAFPKAEDIFKGSIRYSPSIAVKAAIENAGAEVFLFSAKDNKAEADKVISILKSIGSDETAAILCRSRSHLADIIKALKKEAISFRAQDFDPLGERVVIQDLLALTRAMAHPFDRVAWLAILRAPWCAITLDELHKLCVNDKYSPVWSLLSSEDRLNNLSVESRQRLSKLTAEFAKALELRGRISPRALIEGLWISLGGPACLKEEAEANDAESFFNLLDSITVAGEIESMEALEAGMERLFADHGGSADSRVDIMTIHKAKGLEFDHVILPGLGKTPRNDEKQLLIWLENGDDLLLAPVEKKAGNTESAIYDYLRGINKEKTELEQTRLFYVAATRAKKQLYLLGHVKTDEESGEFKAPSRSFLECISHILNSEMIIPVNEAQKEEADEEPVVKIKRLPQDWQMPEPPSAIELPQNEKEVNIEKEPEFYWAGEAIRHLGTALHRYFCIIARQGLDKWDGNRIAGEKGRLSAVLRSLGLSSSQAAKTAAQGIKILSEALKDKRGKWILSSHSEGATEMPITAVVDNEIVHAVIDRTFVDEHGVRWVIDYKTSTHEGGSMEEFLKSEKERYKGQLERYAGILKKGGENREIKKGIYYPALSQWIEW